MSSQPELQLAEHCSRLEHAGTPRKKPRGSVMHPSTHLRLPWCSLLDLLGLLGELTLTAALGCLWARFGVKDVVPPAEAARVIANETFVVGIVVIGAGPEGQEVVQAPGELVARVSVNSLEKTENDPNVHGQDVQFAGNGAPENGRADSAEAKDHDFDRGSVFCGKTEGCRILVVNLVDVLVERTPVQSTVRPVVPGVLEDEEDGDLESHCED